MRRRTAIAAGCLAVALLAVASADRRVSTEMFARSPAGTARDPSPVSRQNAGPMVAPVRRVMPVTPPLPEELIAAGDVEEPSRAPADAPLPERKDLALAAAARAAEAAAAAASVTVTASDDSAAGAGPRSVAE